MAPGSGPGPLHRGIAEHLGADGIGGKHQGRRLTRTANQGRQAAGQDGLTAGGLADQQMAAKRCQQSGASEAEAAQGSVVVARLNHGWKRLTRGPGA